MLDVLTPHLNHNLSIRKTDHLLLSRASSCHTPKWLLIYTTSPHINLLSLTITRSRSTLKIVIAVSRRARVDDCYTLLLTPCSYARKIKTTPMK